jgi:hypothetical protein
MITNLLVGGSKHRQLMSQVDSYGAVFQCHEASEGFSRNHIGDLALGGSIHFVSLELVASRGVCRLILRFTPSQGLCFRSLEFVVDDSGHLQLLDPVPPRIMKVPSHPTLEGGPLSMLMSTHLHIASNPYLRIWILCARIIDALIMRW